MLGTSWYKVHREDLVAIAGFSRNAIIDDDGVSFLVLAQPALREINKRKRPRPSYGLGSARFKQRCRGGGIRPRKRLCADVVGPPQPTNILTPGTICCFCKHIRETILPMPRIAVCKDRRGISGRYLYVIERWIGSRSLVLAMKAFFPRYIYTVHAYTVCMKPDGPVIEPLNLPLTSGSLPSDIRRTAKSCPLNRCCKRKLFVSLSSKQTA